MLASWAEFRPVALSPMEMEAFRPPSDTELRSLQVRSFSRRFSDFREGARKSFHSIHPHTRTMVYELLSAVAFFGLILLMLAWPTGGAR